MAQNWSKENDRFMNLFRKREDSSLYWKIHHLERCLLRMAKEGKDEIEDFLTANDVLTLPVAIDLLSRIWKYNIHLDPLILRTADGNRIPETEVWLGETDEDQYSSSSDSDHVDDNPSDSSVVVSPTRHASPPVSKKTSTKKTTVAKTGLNKKKSPSVDKVTNIPYSSHRTIEHGTGRNENYQRSVISPAHKAESSGQRSFERKNRPGRLAISPQPEETKKRRKSTRDREPEPEEKLTKSAKTRMIKHTSQRSSHKSGTTYGEYKCSKCKQRYMDQKELQKHRVNCQTYN